MSVSGVTHSVYSQQLTSTSKASSGGADRCAGTGSGGSQGTSFAQALQQALSQLNGSGSTTSAAGNGQSAQAAIQAFLQQLLAALHQAGTGAQHASKASDGDADDGVQAASTTGTQASGYNTTIQADLQSLIQQVSASSTSNSGLQQSFQNMLSTMGASSGTDTLGGFLQSIASSMQGSSLISTTA